MEGVGKARKLTGRKPIAVTWVDVNKGDDEHPNVRSRLVARDIRPAGVEAIFAPTPPLEALRAVLSLACTKLEGDHDKYSDASSEDPMQVSLVDVSRAYFNARTDPAHPVFVQLPPEHEAYSSGMCGQLLRHMYGTQQAADGWQQEYSRTLAELGFVQGLASPCVFCHATRRLICSVHGDDFTTAGPKGQLDWFEAVLEQKYELSKGCRIGPGSEDQKGRTCTEPSYSVDPRRPRVRCRSETVREVAC